MSNHVTIIESITDESTYYIFRNSSEEVLLVVEDKVIFTSLELYSYEKQFLNEKFGRKRFEVKKFY